MATVTRLSIYAEFVGGKLDGQRAHLSFEQMRGHGHWMVSEGYKLYRYEARGAVNVFPREVTEQSIWTVSFGVGAAQDVVPGDEWKRGEAAAVTPPITMLHYAPDSAGDVTVENDDDGEDDE